MTTSELTWDFRFLRLAAEISSWSKDPNTKVGAVVVDDDRQILSYGYNGFPRAIADNYRLNDRDQKLKFIVHAESNCIYNAADKGVSLRGGTMYVHGLLVCSECAKALVQIGIKRVVMGYPQVIRAEWRESYKVSSAMFDEAGIDTRFYDSSQYIGENQ